MIFEPGQRRDGVPSAIHVSRFLRAVSEVEAEQGLVTALAASLRGDRVARLPDFGEHLGYDGKALPAPATGRSCPATGAPADPDADWGRHETPGKPDTIGFGSGVHRMADTADEIPVAWQLTRASTSAVKTLESMVPARFREAPELAGGARTSAPTGGSTAGPSRRRCGTPGRSGPDPDPPALAAGADGRSDHDRRDGARRGRGGEPDARPRSEAGGPHRVHGTRRGALRLPGHRDRATDGRSRGSRPIAQRASTAARRRPGARSAPGGPAAASWAAAAPARTGGSCGSRWRGTTGESSRRPRPGACRGDGGYRRRAALERIYRRVDQDFGLERHFVRGQARMQTRIGLTVAVMMAAAVGSIRAGQPGANALPGPALRRYRVAAAGGSPRPPSRHLAGTRTRRGDACLAVGIRRFPHAESVESGPDRRRRAGPSDPPESLQRRRLSKGYGGDPIGWVRPAPAARAGSGWRRTARSRPGPRAAPARRATAPSPDGGCGPARDDGPAAPPGRPAGGAGRAAAAAHTSPSVARAVPYTPVVARDPLRAPHPHPVRRPVAPAAARSRRGGTGAARPAGGAAPVLRPAEDARALAVGDVPPWVGDRGGRGLAT